jgi:hypothetical protein
VLTERDAHLLDKLGEAVEAKRRQLRSADIRKAEACNDSNSNDSKTQDSSKAQEKA